MMGEINNIQVYCAPVAQFVVSSTLAGPRSGLEEKAVPL